MDIDTLKRYVGKDHAQEADTLIANCSHTDWKNLSFKNPTLALILSIFVGFVGIDRLYQGGLKMLGYKLAMVVLTFGTWWLADIYFNKHSVEEANYKKLLSSVA